MGLLKRVLGGDSTTVVVDADWYPLHGTVNSILSVVGESNYQPCIVKTLRRAGNEPPFPLDKWPPEVPERLSWFPAYLQHEPDNPYDTNAVRVSSGFGVVGYLERDRAASYVALLQFLGAHGYRGGSCSAYALQADNGMWGVVLKVSNARQCMSCAKADESFRVG